MGLRDSEGDQACLSATPRMLVGPDPHGRLAWAGWGRPGTPASIQFTVFLLPQASLCNGSMVWHVNLTANWVRTPQKLGGRWLKAWACFF